jgi:hypothetical protein
MFIENSDWEVLTKEGFKSFEGIRIEENVDTIEIITTNQNIRCSKNHLFLLPFGVWESAEQLIKGDVLDGGDVVLDIKQSTKSTVYDLTGVQGTQAYLVGNITNHNCDEFAFIPNTQADEFFTSVYPTITAGKDSKIFMTSTPFGYNHFEKFWSEAHKTGPEWNGFKPIRVHWWQTPGRDQKWYDEQKSILGELKTAQEIDAEFIGSALTLMTGSTLSRLNHVTPIKEFSNQLQGLKLYTDPLAKHAYSICIDVSRGRHLDYSTFIVFDITSYPHTIAATYRNNEIAPSLYATIIEQIGKKYNDAYLLVEINDIGGQVADILWNDLEYENMYFSKSGTELGKTGSDKYPGVRTTVKTKRIGCANLKDMVENNQLLINDYEFIHELSTFIQNTTGSYAADSGFHDDVVMCGVLHAWMTTQPFFRDLTNSDLRTAMHDRHIQEMEDSIMLGGMFSDGNEQYEENNYSHF